MILSKLRLENFKKYTSYNIEFHEGLIGIIGKNGSGKSTIFEAILFALYGELKTKGYKEIIRNATATTKDAVVVELIFEFESMEYRVVREFRGKALSANAKLYKNEELTVSGAKEVTQTIIKLIKMSKDAFLHTLFASQKELTSLSSLKNEDRKKMIRKLLGLEKIDFIEKELVEKSRQLKREIEAFSDLLLGEDEIALKSTQVQEQTNIKDKLSKELTSLGKELDSIILKEINIKKELDVFIKAKDKKQELNSQLELIKNSIDSNSKQHTKLLNELQELQNKQKELKTLEGIKQKYINLSEKLKEQESLKEYYLKKEGLKKEQEQLRVQYRKSQDDIRVLEKECLLYDNHIFDIKNLEQNISILQDNIVDKQTIEKELQAQISGEQKIIDETNKKISKLQELGRNSNCPTCTRPLLEEYDNVINSLSQTIQQIHQKKIQENSIQLKHVKEQKEQFENQLKEKQKQHLELSKAISLIQSKQKDLLKAQEYFEQVEQTGTQNKQELEKLEVYNYDQKEHQNIQNSFNELKVQYEYILSLETQLKRLSSIEKELEDITKTIEQLNNNYNDKELDFKQIFYDETKHKIKEKELDDHQKQKELLSKELNGIKVNIAKCEGEIKTLQTILDKNNHQLQRLQVKKDDLLDYEKIKVSLGEFKTKLNSKVAPRISEISSTMYSTITKGKYQHIEVSNDFDFFIYDDGKKYPIERFSGGEVDLANLVLRIAISKTLTELNGASSVEFLAFDEVFGSQDEARRLEILEAFHTIKEQYRQIFLISHEMEIKEMFERVIEL